MSNSFPALSLSLSSEKDDELLMFWEELWGAVCSDCMFGGIGDVIAGLCEARVWGDGICPHAIMGIAMRRKQKLLFIFQQPDHGQKALNGLETSPRQHSVNDEDTLEDRYERIAWILKPHSLDGRSHRGFPLDDIKTGIRSAPGDGNEVA